MTLEVDTDPDPAWLDVDGLRAEVTAAMRAAPDDTWRIRIVARPRRTLAASVPTPALGWTAARAVEDQGEAPNPVRVERDGRAMTNGRLSVSVRDDGTLRLETSDGVVADGVGRIVDGGDFGDSYGYAPPASDLRVDTPSAVSVAVRLAGPVRGLLAITRRFGWPSGVLDDGSARTAELEETDLAMEVELRADEPFLRVGLAFVNHSDDHRVRFHVPIPRPANASHAEGQFAVVERGLSGEGGLSEEPLATYPAHGWVDAGGMAILLGHLSEYELNEGPDGDAGRELAITVLGRSASSAATTTRTGGTRPGPRWRSQRADARPSADRARHLSARRRLGRRGRTGGRRALPARPPGGTWLRCRRHAVAPAHAGEDALLLAAMP